MRIHGSRFNVETCGDSEVIDLTPSVAEHLRGSSIRNGLVSVFVVGSTAGITTTEFEPGLAQHDLKAAFERIAPKDGTYVHEATWHDDNGHSHVRASLLGPSLTVPVIDGRLCLGQWQQIVLIDFDTRQRLREIILQFLGE